MNKAQLVKEIQEKSQYELSQNVIEDVVNCFMNVVKEKVASGDDVQLIGFGTFTSLKRAAHKGVNPQTGKEMTITACNMPKFKPGKAFKDALN